MGILFLSFIFQVSDISVWEVEDQWVSDKVSFAYGYDDEGQLRVQASSRMPDRRVSLEQVIRWYLDEKMASVDSKEDLSEWKRTRALLLGAVLDHRRKNKVFLYRRDDRVYRSSEIEDSRIGVVPKEYLFTKKPLAPLLAGKSEVEAN